jgi:hypothetical protein
MLPMRPTEQPFHTRRLVTLLFALAVLLPSLYGFGTKFLEFIALYRGDVDGVFAISPILNYLLASIGFLLMFAWAALGGMFHDIEQPKYTLLENESRLNEADANEANLEESPTTDVWSARGLPSANINSPRIYPYRDDHDDN